MLYVSGLTNDASQQFNLTGVPGVNVAGTLQFLPRVQRWIIGLTWGTWTANGIAVVNAPNFLRSFKNVIPFGLACIRTDGLDPFQIDDFANQVANLYLLDSTDVATIEEDWFSPAA
jgi:hypothetical protein